MSKRSNQYTCRLDADLQKDFEECIKITGMDPALLLRESIKAFVETVQRDGEFRMPIALVPKTTLKKPESPKKKPAA